MDSVLTCMVSDRLGPGTLLRDFVQALSSTVGGAGGVAVREYARAIDLAFEALGLVEGARVLLSPLAPSMYRDVIEASGFTPVYCDVEESTGAIDVVAATQFVSEESVDAVVSSAPIGVLPDFSAIAELGVPIIEDVSHCLGAVRDESPSGSYGRFIVLSLEADDIITTGGGAAVVAKSTRDRTALNRAARSISRYSLLPDMNAALGMTQLKELNRYLARRAEIAERYAAQVMRSKHRGLVTPATEGAVGYLYPVLLKGGAREVIGYAQKNDIEVDWAFGESILASINSEAKAELNTPDQQTDDTSDGGATGEEAAFDNQAVRARVSETCPVASGLLLRCVLFPLYPSLTNSEVELVGKVLSTLP